VGELLKLAVSLRPRKIVVGLGGSGTNDGGAGLLAALGATADVPLNCGGAPLAQLTAIDVGPARAALEDVELVAATDVDNPLLGLTGASKTFGPQKGADDNTVLALDAALEIFAGAVGRHPNGKDPAVALGAGAAGGLGYALMQLGATRAPGIATVLAATDFEARVRASDLVVTGEGCFDWQSMRGKVVTGVATTTMPTARPCIVIAGDVLVGRREYSALGIAGAYSVAEFAGSAAKSMDDPVNWLQNASARVARTWSR
ncbi:MAG: glycerate kinase, partial [Actinobacteria bacterium]|nr:glycerate kinase [Actinomycetota bacterium]